MSKSISKWNLTSSWKIRSLPRINDQNINYLLEHEVTVRGDDSLGIEVVAKFVHSLSNIRISKVHLMRGGLVKLTLRRRHNIVKRIGSKYDVLFKTLDV